MYTSNLVLCFVVRRCQVLVFGHEHDQAHTQMPYLRCMWPHLPVLHFEARWAARMYIFDSRCGLGNIVWLAYDCASFNAPGKAKATEIWCGTKLVAFNAQGARALHARILNSKPGRDDLWLRFELEINAETPGCSYVTPPIGSYDKQAVARGGSVRFRRTRFHA